MIITKEFLRAIKRASAIVIRFNEYATIELFDEQNNHYTFNYDNRMNLNGVWYTSLYPSQVMPVTTVINELKIGDDIVFDCEDHAHERLTSDNYIHHQLIIRISRYKAKKPDELLKLMAYTFDSQVTCNTPNLNKVK